MDIYQLKVALADIRPPIWRRIQVPADISLARLHRVLQAAMGWSDTHMHAFRMGRQTFGVADPEFPDGTRSERGVQLEQVAKAGDRFVYEYDFGDGWEHEIVVEEALAAEGAARYPCCLAGERACPPEDCGGLPGYEELVQALGDPAHPEHQEYLKWIGADFDPEAFDLAAVNKKLWASR